MPDYDPERVKTIFLLMEYGELGEWETNFVIDIEKKFKAGKLLTGPQYEKLEEVFERAAERA